MKKSESDAKVNPFAPKLSERNRTDIRKQFAKGTSKRALAKKYNVTRGSITFIISRTMQTESKEK